MHNRLHRFLLVLLGFFFLLGMGAIARAQDEHENVGQEESEAIQGVENTGHEGLEATHYEEGEESEEFSPGDFIFEHIADAHEWHITEIKGKPISIPLPVILYSKTQGLQVFMSGKFEHGHASYKGFRLEESGDNKGKIVAEDGTLPLDLSITKNVVGIFLSIIILFWVFLSAGKAYKRNPMGAPKGIQSVVEPVIVFVRDEVAIPSIGEKKYERFMPFLLTIFFFILILFVSFIRLEAVLTTKPFSMLCDSFAFCLFHSTNRVFFLHQSKNHHFTSNSFNQNYQIISSARLSFSSTCTATILRFSLSIMPIATVGRMHDA